VRRQTRAAIDAVQQALELVRDRVGSEHSELKAARDLVTGTDLAVEASLREVLGDAVVGEESGGERGRSYWLVDPICGTRNFASGIPLYCVNVALVEEGDVTVAVVGDPSGEILVAERGGGAWSAATGRPLSVSSESEVLVIEDSHADRDEERRARAARAVAAAIVAFRWDIRALSTTLALPYVASGRVAAYVLFWTSAVHVAAGSLLVTEAGGVVSDVDGRPWTVDSDSIVAAATPELHAELLAL
jgi:myo-inositol-1(or 4)-monophosphatase